MKIVHVCLSMGYTEGLNYQENVIIKYQARDGLPRTIASMKENGDFARRKVTISIRMAFIL